MKNKGTLILGSLVALTIGYAIFDVKMEEREEKAKSEKALILNLKKESISEVEIKGVTETVVLKKETDGWKFGSTSELADQNEVNTFIDGLVTEQSDDVISAQPIDWKIYGLDLPSGEISVQSQDGKKERIQIGSKKNFQGNAYLKKDELQQVFVANSTWPSKIEKKSFDFKDKRIMRMPVASVREVKLHNVSGDVILKSVNGQWVVVGQEKKKLDQNKVREFLKEFNNPIVTKFITDKKPTPAQISEYGLNKVKFSVEITHEDQKKWHGDFFEMRSKAEKYSVRESGRTIEIPLPEHDKIFHTSLNSLRDRKEPFVFKADDVVRLEVMTPLKVFKLVKDQQWKLEPNDEKLVVDSEKVDGLVNQLQEIEVAQFKDIVTHPSLKNPEYLLSLKDKDGKTVFELKVGSTEIGIVDETKTDVSYAQTNLYPEVFTLKRSTFDLLGADQLTVNKELIEETSTTVRQEP